MRGDERAIAAGRRAAFVDILRTTQPCCANGFAHRLKSAFAGRSSQTNIMSQDLELRIRAAEYLVRVLAKWLNDDVLDDAAATILAELMSDLSDEEQRVRALALELLTTTGQSGTGVLVGKWVEGGGSVD
jgi:hypothetical protein